MQFKLSILRLPFEWRAPIPYLLATAFEISVGFHIPVIYVIVILLYIGLCALLTTFAADLEEELRTFEMGNVQDINRQSTGLIGSRIKIKKKLYEFIQFHAETTQ